MRLGHSWFSGAHSFSVDVDHIWRSNMTATELIKKNLNREQDTYGRTRPSPCVREFSKLIQLTIVEVSSDNEIDPRSGFGLCLTQRSYKG